MCRRRMLMLVFGWLLVVSVSGCIANITGPSAWVSNTRLDVNDLKVGEHVITGEATSWAVLLGLVAWGDSGFEAALQDAKRKAGIKVTAINAFDTAISQDKGNVDACADPDLVNGFAFKVGTRKAFLKGLCPWIFGIKGEVGCFGIAFVSTGCLTALFGGL